MSMKRLSRCLAEACDEWMAHHGRSLVFYCPGCRGIHVAEIEKPNAAGGMWTWNGSVDAPTLQPSLNVGPGHCHFFLVNGELQYLSDCKHNLAGRTIALPVLTDDDLGISKKAEK